MIDDGGIVQCEIDECFKRTESKEASVFFWNGGPSRLTDLVQISLKKEDSINEAAKDWTRSHLVEILLSTLRNDFATASGV